MPNEDHAHEKIGAIIFVAMAAFFALALIVFGSMGLIHVGVRVGSIFFTIAFAAMNYLGFVTGVFTFQGGITILRKSSPNLYWIVSLGFAFLSFGACAVFIWLAFRQN